MAVLLGRPISQELRSQAYKTVLVFAVGAIVLTRISMRFSGSYSHASFLPFKLDLFLLASAWIYNHAERPGIKFGKKMADIVGNK